MCSNLCDLEVARQPVVLHTCDHSKGAGVCCIGEESESCFAVEDKADRVTLEYVVSAHHLNYPSNVCTKFLARSWKEIYYEHTLCAFNAIYLENYTKGPSFYCQLQCRWTKLHTLTPFRYIQNMGN